MVSKEINATVNANGMKERLLSATWTTLKENHSSNGTSVIHQLLLDGLRVLHNASIETANKTVNHPLPPQWESTVFGPLLKSSFQKDLVSSAPLEPSVPRLQTTSNALLMEMTLLLVLLMQCAKFNNQAIGTLNSSLANKLHTTVQLQLLQILQTTALASSATINV